MRGAEFEWSDRGTTCSVRPFIRPLYQPSRVFLNDAVFSGSVESPDFEPMLFDRLAVEVFEPLGKVSTIEDFIGSEWGKRLWLEEAFYSILLSRGLEEAKAIAAELDEGDTRYLEKCKARLATANREKDVEMKYARRLELKSAEEDLERSKERQALVARGEAAVFEHYRAREGEVARGHKVEQAWEPSPFPAQLPASRRAAKSADPKLTPTPWLDFPATWREDPPETPGWIRFAIRWWYRQDRLELLHPITREQAEARHRNFEDYVLATRLPAGQMLIVGRSASSMVKQLPLVRYILWIYDSQGQRMIVDFQEDLDDRGILRMSSIDIKGGKQWHSHLNFRRNEIAIHDDRNGETHYECRKMTDVQRAAYAFPLPTFGEFETVWQHISMHLDAEGFGVFA